MRPHVTQKQSLAGLTEKKCILGKYCCLKSTVLHRERERERIEEEEDEEEDEEEEEREEVEEAV